MRFSGLSLLLVVIFLVGCATDWERRKLDDIPKDQVIAAAQSNRICNALTEQEIVELTGRHLAALESISPTANWCRFTLDDGQWFSILVHPFPKSVDIPGITCADEQNDPTAYRKMHYPHCIAIIREQILQIQSTQYGGLPKSIMEVVLQRAVPHL